MVHSGEGFELPVDRGRNAQLPCQRGVNLKGFPGFKHLPYGWQEADGAQAVQSIRQFRTRTRGSSDIAKTLSRRSGPCPSAPILILCSLVTPSARHATTSPRSSLRWAGE